MRVPFLLASVSVATTFRAPVPSRAIEPATAAPTVLDPVALDRVTAGSSASAELALGDAPRPQVQPEPPRRPRDLLPWLRWRIGCALPGRVCIQARG
jgi:hypothetical protein